MASAYVMNKHLASAEPHHHERCPCVVVSGWSPLTWQMSRHSGGSTLRFYPNLGVERQRQVLPGRQRGYMAENTKCDLIRVTHLLSSINFCKALLEDMDTAGLWGSVS